MPAPAREERASRGGASFARWRRRHRGLRQRRGHSAGERAAHLRALLHDEGGGQRHGSGLGDLPAIGERNGRMAFVRVDAPRREHVPRDARRGSDRPGVLRGLACESR